MKKEEYQNVRRKHLRTRSKREVSFVTRIEEKKKHNNVKEFSYTSGKRAKT